MKEAIFKAALIVAKRQKLAQPIMRVSRQLPLLASEQQKAAWSIQALHPQAPINNLSVSYELSGLLDTNALEKSFFTLACRHEVLRTSLWKKGSELLQKISCLDDFYLEIIEAEDRDVDLYIHEQAQVPILPEDPLQFRAYLLRRNHNSHSLAITVSYLSVDAISFEVFMEELCSLYKHYVTEDMLCLEDPGIQYADYSGWQKTRFESSDARLHYKFWRSHYGMNPPVSRLPTSGLSDESCSGQGGYCLQSIDSVSISQIDAFAQLKSVSSYLILLAAFIRTLSRCLESSDFLLGLALANRSRLELKSAVGLFANFIPLRFSLSDTADIDTMLLGLSELVASAIQYQEFPYQSLLSRYGRPDDVAPMPNVVFNFLGFSKSQWGLHNIKMQGRNIANNYTRQELSITVYENGGRPCALVQYNSQLYESSMVASLLADYSRDLSEVVSSVEMS